MSLPTLELHARDDSGPTTGATVLQLRPVPPLEPPYDDVVEAPTHQALHLVPGGPADGPQLVIEAPAPTLPFADLRLSAPAEGFAARLTPRAELPDPHRWTSMLVQAMSEVLAGRRPLQQLMPWTDEGVYLQITGRLRRRRSPAVPPRVSSVHLSEPRDGVIEACAVLRNGARNQAVALRLEGKDGRWRCTALQFG